MPVVKQFADETTCHGVNYLVNSRSKIWGFLWFILICCCLAMLTWQLHSLIKNYTNKDDKWTTTVFETQGSAFEIPTVTVCNFNRVKKSVAEGNDFTPALAEAFYGLYFVASYPISMDYVSVDESMNKLEAYLNEKSKTVKDLFDEFSHQCYDTFLTVSVGRTKLAGYSICEGQQTSFEGHTASINPLYSPELGRCFQLHVQYNGTIDPGFSGIGNGLSVMLNTQSDEYMALYSNNYFDEGFALQLTYGGRVEYGQWLTAQGGQHTWIGIQQHVTRLRKKDLIPFDPPCFDASEANMTIYRDIDYTITFCRMDCVTTAKAERCGCISHMVNGSKNELHRDFPLCTLPQLRKCRQIIEAQQEEINAEVEKCRKTCKERCHVRQVSPTITTTRFPSKAQAKMMARDYNTSVDDFSNYYAAIDIYYKTTSVKVVERHERSTIEDLVSNVGGQLGLWLGGSVITVTHLVFYLCQIVIPNKQVSPDGEEEKENQEKIPPLPNSIYM